MLFSKQNWFVWNDERMHEDVVRVQGRVVLYLRYSALFFSLFDITLKQINVYTIITHVILCSLSLQRFIYEELECKTPYICVDMFLISFTLNFDGMS